MPSIFQTNPKPTDPKQAARTIWIIYGALLLGELFFCAILSMIVIRNDPPVQPPKVNPVLIIVSGAFLSAIAAGFFIRRQLINKALANGRPIASQQLSTACIIYWATCEGPAFFALMVVIIHRSFFPTIFFFAFAFICQAAGYPRTQLLRPADETFGGDLLQR